MKILIPIGAFYPDQSGGPSNSLYWLSKALVSKGIEVEIITSNRGIIDIPLNVKLNFDYGNIIYCRTSIHYLPFKLIRESIKALKRNDILILTGFFYPPSLIIAIFALFKKKKIIWSTRGELYSNSLKFNRFLKKMVIFFVKNTIATNLVFHSTCPEESKTINDTLGNDVRLFELPNYMELPKLESRTNNNKYLLYVGRIQPDKSVDKLITGFGLSIKAKELQISLKIAGENNNEFAKSLKKIVKKEGLEGSVNFIGYVSGRQKNLLYANAYFSFLISDSENFGNVVVESMAQGTPVIVSKNAPWEILELKKAGFWIENNPENIAATIDEILAMQNDEYLLYRENALNLVNDEFDVNKNISKWIHEFDNLLSEKRSK